MIKDLFGILAIVCECDKVRDVGEYLDYENCKCRKTLVAAPLTEECTETVEEVKLAKVTHAENKNSCKCSFCAVYTVILDIFYNQCWWNRCLFYLFSQVLRKDVYS